ncbi:MAG: protein kinase [Solumvirus sp.]|uniref:Protein kinase n=1 Tax=Solumvirus sp. TaxID=2487773 RepID=A0A3G5AGC2_9VIRU|nr:MAG: protein kinase [Solumvirus sp.]
MSLTSEQVNQSYKTLNKYSIDNAATLIEAVKRQNAKEKTLIAEYSPCVSYMSPVKEADTSDIGDIKGKLGQQIGDNLSNIKPNKLKAIVSDRFFQSEAMEMMSCITDNIFYGPSTSTNTVMHHAIREYFRNLKRIGAPSAEGYAMNGIFGFPSESLPSGSVKDLFIIKTAQDPHNDKLFHEMFIGTYGTNSLRSVVPNFAYIYGGVKCSPTWIAQNEQVATWCTHGSANDVTYLVYENVSPNVSLTSALKDMTSIDFLNYYLQILYSLKAGMQIDFTHYDLHSDNVLLRTYVHHTGAKYKVCIQYTTENGIEYFVADRIATIIDYGLSHIKHQGSSYGVYDRIAYSILPELGWPIFDAYKLLMFSARWAKENKNINVFDTCKTIYSFFSTVEDIDSAINLQWNYRYSLPYNDFTKGLTVDSLAIFVRSKFQCPFITTREPASLVVPGTAGSGFTDTKHTTGTSDGEFSGIVSLSPGTGNLSLGRMLSIVGVKQINDGSGLKNIFDLYDFVNNAKKMPDNIGMTPLVSPMVPRDITNVSSVSKTPLETSKISSPTLNPFASPSTSSNISSPPSGTSKVLSSSALSTFGIDDSKINYQLIMDNTRKEVEGYASTIDTLTAKNKMANIDLSVPAVVFRYDTMIRYRTILDSVAKINDIYYMLKMIDKSLRGVLASPLPRISEIQKSGDLSKISDVWGINPLLKKLRELIDYTKRFLNEWSQELTEDDTQLDKLVKTQEYKEAMKQDSRLVWYSHDRKLFLDVLK